jgi:hypothetical protein
MLEEVEVQVPPLPVELKVVTLPTQRAEVPVMVPALGAAVTVITKVEEALAQPPVPLTVYVIVAVPAAVPVTTPALLIGAMLEEVEVQVPPLAVEVKVVTLPIQRAEVPVMVPALGAAVTFITKVEEALAQPPVPLTVYVIVAVPAAVPVTTPALLIGVPESTTSSTRIGTVPPVFLTKRSLSPLICAAAGSAIVLAGYQPVAAVAASLKRAAAVLAKFTQAVPFQ